MIDFLARFPGVRARRAVGACLVVFGGLLLLYGVELAWRYQWASDRLAEIEPRYARLAGLVAAEPQLAEQTAAARKALGALAYPPEQTAEKIGADLQQRIRASAEAAGLRVLSTQILPPRRQGEVEFVLLNTSLQGDGDQFRDFLVGLRGVVPAIHIETIVMHRERAREAVSPKLYQLGFSAIRLLP